ncbi:PREDICTED: bromodomain and WD [Prunus dulcis]|nr:PREDICTED: bromodomain and WD [Prunus dulcis]
MDPWKCTLSGGANSLSMAPPSILHKVNEKAQPEKEERDTGHVVEAGVDIDIREVYFLIMHFLSVGPCQRTFEQFGNDLLEHQLLPRRYHAWFSRSGVGSGNNNDDAISFPLSYNKLVERYPHIERDHLVKLLKQLILSIATPLHGKVGRSAPNAADVPTLLGTGSFSLLDCDRTTENKRVKPLPAHLRWPYMQADQVHGLSLREIGGGFTKHHRAPSIRSACYAIAKPSTMVQKMNNKKKLRGHRNAVYCAIFDRSGRYVITGSDDRLVKIWSMETALCLASCRGHEGDITDLAVSSNNALVASASNDFAIRVWRLPDGFPISVLQGHTGAVTAIAFSPRLSAVYQLLSSSDDGTCRIWDARSSQYPPRIYMPQPSDSLTGRSNAISSTGPSSSNGPQSHQILCCAYNANGTVFVTGSSDTFARVWNALKSNTDDSEQPIHELDVLSGHENDVNYVQFSGCAISSKSSFSDSLKEESNMKFKNSWFCHNNIVTCSRDGSAIIWVPRSHRSHGKVGRWTRAYHLKVPPPPLPPQPPRGGPRQRFLPTPRGVNMIVWSLDNRFVLAAIMDCRICVWNAVDGSIVHSLTGHTASSYVLDVHPFNPRIAMSAGYDGQTIVWDIWEGMPIKIYEIGNVKLVDGKFSADGTSIVLSDDVGQVYLINTGEGESQKDAKYDQFFLGDYRPLARDDSGYPIDQETQLPAYRRNLQDPLCDSSMMPYPEPYQSTYQQRRLGALGMEWHPSSMKFSIGMHTGLDYQMPPLPDLERMIEPLPDFFDAMLWEPENEVASEDTDSEYHGTEENSSEDEKGNITTSSSSDPDCSTEYSEAECSHKDGLRRSRRKRQKVESITCSERRGKKRKVDEHDGIISGIEKIKNSKGGRKVSKRKPSAKTLRPQRVAARNARNVLSQIPGTSTDGEKDEDDSSNSDSLEQQFHIQSYGGNQMMQQKHTKEEPSVHEFEDIAKPLAVSSSQSNVRSKPKLVFKIPLRDSKKQEAPQDVKIKYKNQADLVSPSSGYQDVTQDKRINKGLGSSLLDVIDVELSGNLIDNEFTDPGKTAKAGNSLKASPCDKDNRVGWGEVKIRTPKHIRSGNPIPTEAATGSLASFDVHMKERNYVNWDEERNGTDALEDLDGLKSKELSHTLISSSFESSALGERKPKGIEDSLEIEEAAGTMHSDELKYNAPLKFSAEHLTGYGDLMPEDPSCMDQNLNLEMPKVSGGAGRPGSLKFFFKGRTNSEGVDGNMEENTSNVNNRHDSGIDLPEAAVGAIRGTRTLKIKATSGGVGSVSRSLKLRWGHQTAGTSKDAEDSSVKVYDQIYQRPRSTRNRQGSYNDYDQSSSTRSMLDTPVGKLSWLMLSKHEPGYRYIPQLGDEVVYLRQGHQEYLEVVMKSEVGPWGPWGSIKENIKAVEICKVESLDYASQPGSGESCSRMELKFVDPSSAMFGKPWNLTLPEIDFSDFIVEKIWYDAAIRRNWTTRDKCEVWWRDSDGGGDWWEGQIVRCQAKSHEFPDSPWLRYEIRYKNDDGITHCHCPWELRDPSILLEHPHINSESRDKLLHYFSKLEQKDSQTIQQMNQAVWKADFCNSFPVQLYPELIQSRLRNDYYRSLEAVEHDIMVMLSNARQYFKRNELQARIRHLSKWFKKKLSRLQRF